MLYLLAQSDSLGWKDSPRLHTMSDAIKNHWSGAQMPPTIFIVIAIVLLMMLAVVWYWKWQNTRYLRSEPILTFRYIAKEVGLTMREQVLLIRIAHRLGLASPLTLILSQGTLEHHVELYARQKHPMRQKQVYSQAKKLSKRLFE